MDYIVTNKDGKELVVEEVTIEKSKSRIEAYYNALIQHKRQEDDEHTKKMIKFFVDSMEDEEAFKLEAKIKEKDSGYSDIINSDSEEAFTKRLNAYMTRIKEFSPEQKDLCAPIQEITEKYSKFDFDTLVREEINGNIFTYRKDRFPIEQYRQELEEIGNRSKGNRWAVSISSDGRLVIY